MAMADPYSKALDAFLPPNALYQTDLSKTKTEQDNAFLKKMQGKFYTDKTDTHIFLSDRSFEEILKHFSDKGIKLKKLDKEKKIAELKKQESEKLKPLIDLLKDPAYHEATGMFQGWLIQVYSPTTVAGQKLSRTTIVFSKSKKKEIR